MFQIDVNYPAMDEEIKIVRSTTGSLEYDAQTGLEPRKDIRAPEPGPARPGRGSRDQIRGQPGALTGRPRKSPPHFVREMVAWGAGPRASQYLILGGKARALINGRFAASCDDVRALAQPVLKHRIIVNYRAEAEGVDSSNIIARLLAEVKEDAEQA